MEGSKDRLSERGIDPIRARVEAALSEARQRHALGDVHGARELALSVLALGEEYVEPRQLLVAVKLAAPPKPVPPPQTLPLRQPPARPAAVRAAPRRPALPVRAHRRRPALAVGLVSGVLLALAAGSAWLWTRGSGLEEAAVRPHAVSVEPVAPPEPAPLPAPSASPAPPGSLVSSLPLPVTPPPPAPLAEPDPAPPSGATMPGSQKVRAAVVERTVATSAAEAASTPIRSVEDDRQEILEVIRRYVAAMETRNLGALKAVWPTVAGEQERRIRSSFHFARAMRVHLNVRDIHVGDSVAVVSCHRRDAIVTADGETWRHERPGTINLVRSDSWKIAGFE